MFTFKPPPQFKSSRGFQGQINRGSVICHGFCEWVRPDEAMWTLGWHSWQSLMHCQAPVPRMAVTKHAMTICSFHRTKLKEQILYESGDKTKRTNIVWIRNQDTEGVTSVSHVELFFCFYYSQLRIILNDIFCKLFEKRYSKRKEVLWHEDVKLIKYFLN